MELGGGTSRAELRCDRSDEQSLIRKSRWSAPKTGRMPAPIPEARLQKLLGHAHAGTTRRYASHSPGQFLEADAQLVARSMGVATGAPLRLERRA